MITRVEDILGLVRSLDKKYRFVLACADDESALGAVDTARKMGLIEAILVGQEGKIAAVADKIGVNMGDFECVEAGGDVEAVDTSLELIKAGRADIIMKGHVNTRCVLKGVLNKKYGFHTGRILSHIGLFNLPDADRILIVTDAGANLEPNTASKKDILLNAVDVAHALGNECPRVAMLSFIESDVPDPRVRSTKEALIITEMNKRGEITGCVVGGPYSLDVAVSPEAAKIKGVKGEVAGKADIVVTHDVGVGNVLYKAMMLWCHTAMACTIMGAKISVNIASRADSMDTKLNSIALSILMAHNKQESQL